MQRHLILLTLLLTLASCLPAIQPPRVSRELVVPEPPDVAYSRAVKATMGSLPRNIANSVRLVSST